MKRALAAVAVLVVAALGATAADLVTQGATSRVVDHVTVQNGDTYASIGAQLCPSRPTAQANDLRNSNGSASLNAGRVLHYHPDVCSVPTTTASTTTTIAVTTSSPAPTTTTIASTTTAATTTTQPPQGVLFSEDFTGDTMADFTATFDWSVADLNVGGRNTNPWSGHHNMACEGPTTERQLVHGPANDNVNPGAEFWLCGPGGPETDHLMTSNGRDNVFGVTAFSPKQSFTGNRICFDVNLTQSPGRRRWWEVQILPANYVANAISLGQMGTAGSSEERGTAFLDWGAGVTGTLQNRILPLGGFIWDFTEEINHVWRGNEPEPNTAGFDVSQAATMIFGAPFSTRFATNDRATREHHCWVDNENGTMTIRQTRTGLPDFVQTVNGSFPKPYRVIFADHNYDSGKDGSLDSQTFHWDNILVASS